MSGNDGARREIVDDRRARELLNEERKRVQRLFDEVAASSREDREAADQAGDMADSAEPLTAEGADDAVVEGLRERLAALDRAEERLATGTFGRSIRSGAVIPDDRLEADPAAELTVEEANETA
jgi:DnaK suppressor protein